MTLFTTLRPVAYLGGQKENLLRNVHENVVASAGGLDEAVSFAPAERPHFSLLDGVTHGPVRSGGGGMKKKKIRWNKLCRSALFLEGEAGE